MVTLAVPALSHAALADGETVLPEISVSVQVLGQKTEGTESCSTGSTKTAMPLSTSLRDTPQSVSLVTAQQIEDQGFLNITDVVNSVSGVSVNQYASHRAQFTARGFDINASMIDGVPTSWSQAWSSGEILTSMAIYDRIEVVRGSTGLTSGAGNPSAAINLVPKRASSKQLVSSIDELAGLDIAKR